MIRGLNIFVESLTGHMSSLPEAFRWIWKRSWALFVLKFLTQLPKLLVLHATFKTCYHFFVLLYVDKFLFLPQYLQNVGRHWKLTEKSTWVAYFSYKFCIKVFIPLIVFAKIGPVTGTSNLESLQGAKYWHHCRIVLTKKASAGSCRLRILCT